MNLAVSSYQLAVRQHGSCRGTLWRQQGSARNSGSGSGMFGFGSSSSSLDTVKTCDYCVLTGVRFRCYESTLSYQKGDLPLASFHIVGASAWKPRQKNQQQQPTSTYSYAAAADTSFRLVSDQGTHIYCQAPTTACRDLWLSALHAGLEQSLLHGDVSTESNNSSNTKRGSLAVPKKRLSPPSSQTPAATAPARRSFVKAKAPQVKYCHSCGAAESANKLILVAAVPLTQYGKESRCDVCRNCLVAQGLLDHLEFVKDCLTSAKQEREALETARQLFYKIMREEENNENENDTTSAAAATPPKTTPGTAADEDEEEEEEEKPAEENPNDATTSTPPTTEPSTTTSTPGDTDTAAETTAQTTTTTTAETALTESGITGDSSGSGSSHITKDDNTDQSSGGSSESWAHVHGEDGATGGEGASSSISIDVSNNSASTSSGASGPATKDPMTGSWLAVENPPPQTSAANTKWINLPPTKASTKACFELLQDPARFGGLARSSLTLEHLSQQVFSGNISVADFMEELEEAVESREGIAAAALKRQAFRVAGADMGTALKLLLDNALPSTSLTLRDEEKQHGSNYHGNDNTEMLSCILDFFLDLVQDGELSTVGLFWPQLCHIHLRMLPPENATALARVELMEDFLLTVASRYSIHLALELAWSHTADLEESLSSIIGGSGSGSGGAGGGSTSTASSSSYLPPCAVACRRRRFAVLRFVCELESLLFDFEDGWGGGSVSLGNMLAPTGDHVNLLKATMLNIRELRKTSPNRLTRSFRLDKLMSCRGDKPPAEEAQEKLRIAKNAEYFSSHFNFTRRICDIAEKLRFMEQEDRSGALEEELNLLNSSGSLGGDPLNKIQDDLVRVLRVPKTEGHVFRSKERTPVLLLMEVIDEGAEREIIREDDMRQPAPAQKASSEKVPVSLQETEKPEKTDCAGTSSDDHGAGEEIVPAEIIPDSVVDSPTRDNANLRSSQRVKFSPGSPGAALPSAPYADDLLEGATAGVKPSPRFSGLKRFDYAGDEPLDPPTTPKHDVELFVNSVMEQQIMKEVPLPDLSLSSGGGPPPPIKPSEVLMVATSEDMDATAIKPDVSEALESYDRSGAKDSTELRVATVAEAGVSEVPEAIESSGIKDASDRKSSKKKATLSNLAGSPGEGSDSNKLAPTGDARRDVLNAIMVEGKQGNTIAAGAAVSVQRSLQELERKRATELLMSDDDDDDSHEGTWEGSSAAYDEIESTRQKLVSLGFGSLSPNSVGSEGSRGAPTEEDEVMEAIRLLLIQNRVAQGQLSEADAAKVLQHNSLKRTHSDIHLSPHQEGDHRLDPSEMPTIDAGDVDSRLVGCGALPPAILQALTLWKGEVVSNAELLELVKRDLEFLRHSVLHEAENVEKLNENSAFWGRFAFGERWAEKKSRIAATSPEGSCPGWDLLGVIVKSNDDLRQEAFVMQLIQLSQEAFELAGLELWVNPYRILATGRTTGVIEMVRNAMSVDALKKRPGYGKGGLREHLQRMTEFTADPGGAFKSAQQNFVRSLAAYSLMSYFFLFKDRHNGNILLDTAGHVIHIDFGFVFGVAPGGSFSLEMSTPFKLTEDMINVMGGLTSPLFSEFVTLFCCGFLAIQSFSGTFLTVVEIMCDGSTFKCFEGAHTEDIVSRLRERFCLDRSKEETVSFALDLIKQATTSYGTRQYDMFQYLSQGIAA